MERHTKSLRKKNFDELIWDDIERIEHLLGGARRCTFKISPRNNSKSQLEQENLETTNE